MGTEIASIAPQPASSAPVQLGYITGNSADQMLASATELATPLAAMIEQQGLSVMLQGKPYVRVEGWTTLATMLGCLPYEVSNVETDGVYVSTVEMRSVSTGHVLSRATAECGSEDTWKKRPANARRSMANTRATSKACRMGFSWVMAIAGYETTPLEEMTEVIDGAFETERVSGHKRQSKPDVVEATMPLVGMDGQVEAQRYATKLGVDYARVTKYVERATKGRTKSVSELTHSEFIKLMGKLQGMGEERRQMIIEMLLTGWLMCRQPPGSEEFVCVVQSHTENQGSGCG